MDNKAIVTAEQELTVRHLCDSLVRRLLDGAILFDATRDGLVALAEDRPVAEAPKAGDKKHTPKRSRAEERRILIEANYRAKGHLAVTVPRPSASNRNFADWEQSNLGLFYRPADSELTYEAWMTSHGQASHWTVTDETERAKIVWEPCKIGYWFLAEIAPACPRTKTSWNDLTAPASGIRLLSLEEYAVVYWTHRDLTGLRIDVSTWCWLRTRCGSGALYARDCVGGINVYRFDASLLAVPCDLGGGRRCVEVVLKPAA
ncbi:MAG: hypothetical protein WCO25_06085 [Candidatus Uhrbacteria bacterium]